MPWKKTDDTYYGEIAAAIRSKNGTQNTYTPPQMGAAINNVQTVEELNSDNLINPVILNGTSVAPHLFYGKQSITNIIFPNVVSIGDYAFESCANLAITSLPSGITSIGNYAFYQCPNIPFLDFSEFDHIPTLGMNNFIGANSRYPFYFRDQQQLDQWAAATNWSTLASRFQIKPSEVI